MRENILGEKEAIKLGYAIGSDKHYHGLGESLYLKVIEDLDDISEAYRGTKNTKNPERRENYFVLISKHKDSDQNEIIVPIHIEKYERYAKVHIWSNKVATVFVKEGMRDWLRTEIKNGNLVRIKKEALKSEERRHKSPAVMKRVLPKKYTPKLFEKSRYFGKYLFGSADGKDRRPLPAFDTARPG